MKTIGIIPARLASARFPRKPLAKILGRTMIEHVYRRAKKSQEIDDIYIATCDKEIAKSAEEFGCKTIMTSASHIRGTDRVAEAAGKVDADIILNIQGDEPLVDPESLDRAVRFLKEERNAQCVNLVSPITSWDFFIDPNVVKAVVDQNNNILYFSRQPIPTAAKEDFRSALKQIGIYIFRKNFLMKFSQWKETPLEISEKVDMVRILENGFEVKAFFAADMISVDTPDDLKIAGSIIARDPLYLSLFGKADIRNV